MGKSQKNLLKGVNVRDFLFNDFASPKLSQSKNLKVKNQSVKNLKSQSQGKSIDANHFIFGAIY